MKVECFYLIYDIWETFTRLRLARFFCYCVRCLLASDLHCIDLDVAIAHSLFFIRHFSNTHYISIFICSSRLNVIPYAMLLLGSSWHTVQVIYSRVCCIICEFRFVCDVLHLVCLTETVKTMSRNYQTIHIISLLFTLHYTHILNHSHTYE